MAGGQNLFEVLYGKEVRYLDYNLQRVLLECLVHDNEIEQDFRMEQEYAAPKKSGSKGGVTLRSQVKLGNLRFAAYLNRPENKPYARLPVTLLTTEEYLEVIDLLEEGSPLDGVR